MSERKQPIVNNEYYHILNRSIAQYAIFNDQEDFHRIIEMIDLYRFENFTYKYSAYCELSPYAKDLLLNQLEEGNKDIDIICYCIMPTHFHLLLKQNKDMSISNYISKILNSYTRYFNIKHHRKGPLWEGRFKNILVENDEQLLHLTRYIHLNPSSAGIVKNPKDWIFSSYNEYLNSKDKDNICDMNSVFSYSPNKYREFVNSRTLYQKELSKIKHLILDDYSG